MPSYLSQHPGTFSVLSSLDCHGSPGRLLDFISGNRKAIQTSLRTIAVQLSRISPTWSLLSSLRIFLDCIAMTPFPSSTRVGTSPRSCRLLHPTAKDKREQIVHQAKILFRNLFEHLREACNRRGGASKCWIPNYFINWLTLAINSVDVCDMCPPRKGAAVRFRPATY